MFQDISFHSSNCKCKDMILWFYRKGGSSLLLNLHINGIVMRHNTNVSTSANIRWVTSSIVCVLQMDIVLILKTNIQVRTLNFKIITFAIMYPSFFSTRVINNTFGSKMVLKWCWCDRSHMKYFMKLYRN